MKPLLIIPPAPARWPALQALSLDEPAVCREDFEKRFAQGVPGAQDALAIIPDGGHVLGCGCVSKRHDLGVLSRVYTQPEHRGRGLGQGIMQTLLEWFEMTGGKWLYATTTADVALGFFEHFGFRTIRRSPRSPQDAVVMVRTGRGLPVDPLSVVDGEISIHDPSRANWPTMATLLYNRPGADPRVGLDESAVTAEVTALELLNRQEAGTCQLKAAFQGPRLVGLGSVATEQSGDRTYAMIMPHAGAPPRLREVLIEFARTKGYEQVIFPLEGLAPPPAEILPGSSASSAVT